MVSLPVCAVQEKALHFRGAEENSDFSVIGMLMVGNTVPVSGPTPMLIALGDKTKDPRP